MEGLDLASEESQLPADRREAPSSSADQTAPSVSGEDQMLDMTEKIELATREMEAGQMLHTPHFDLESAMSATEIMNPKMDPGIDAVGIRSPEECLKDGSLPQPSSLSPAELIGVMDYLLACQGTWIEGQSLAHTLYTCLYVNLPDCLETSKWLNVYVKMIMYSCSVLRRIIVAADVYSDEDFVTAHSGYDKIDAVSDEDANNACRELEDDISRQRSWEESDELWNALQMRIRFCRALYVVLSNLQKRGLEAIRKSIAYTCSQLPAIKESVRLGVIPRGAFEPLINKRLCIPSPMRDVSIVSREEGLEIVQRNFQQLLVVCSLQRSATLRSVLSFFGAFNKSEPGLVARSFLQLLVSKHWDRAFERKLLDLIKEDMAEFPLPLTHIGHKTVVAFLDSAEEVVAHTLKLYCYNHASQHRRVGSCLLDWDMLQDKAEALDTALQEVYPLEESEKVERILRAGEYLGSWVMAHKMEVMIYYLFLGFDLDLYEPCEYLMIFWYLDYLLGLRCQIALNMKEIVNVKMKRTRKMGSVLLASAFASSSSLTNNAIGRRGRKKNKKSGQQSGKMSPIQLVFECLHHAVRGVFRHSSAMFCAGLIKNREFALGSEELRFDRRFAQLRKCYVPTPLQYKHFKHSADFSQYKAEVLFGGAVDSYKASKERLTEYLHSNQPERQCPPLSHEDCQKLLRVLVSNIIETEKLLSSDMLQSDCPSSEMKSAVDWDFTVLSYLPIIRTPKRS